jgi:hypothetical protein
MAAVKTFRELIAWQRAMDLACAVYRVTALFPNEELYKQPANSGTRRFRFRRTSEKDRRAARESSATIWRSRLGLSRSWRRNSCSLNGSRLQILNR